MLANPAQIGRQIQRLGSFLPQQALTLITALPTILRTIGLPSPELWGEAIRWPSLLFMDIVACALLYRFGPSRASPRWRWFSAGAVLATVLWLGAYAADDVGESKENGG